MKIKKVLLILILIVIIIGGIVLVNKLNTKKEQVDTDKLQIVVSNFASYDFLRAIIGDTSNENVELTFLLGPGKDAHGYDPTAADIIKIQNSDIFVYVGGEMEKWSSKVLDSLDMENTKVICIADDIETISEKEIDGAEPEEHEHEDEEEHEDEIGEEYTSFDEHIWTSPKNAIIMINSLKDALSEIDYNNKDKYEENANNYINEINKIDLEIKEVVDNKVRNRLIFGDKMPMQYFMDYYGLDVSAAFSGCSTETEPSSKTISYLVDKAKSENIPVILYIELNTGKVANVIANEVGNGCKALQIQTLHNVSKDDFDNGETYVSLMEKNINVLKEALQ